MSKMKGVYVLIILGLYASQNIYSQETIDIPPKAQLVSMDNTTIKYNTTYGQQFFANGSDIPYNGFLCSYYDNGQFETIQQFENGIANGVWINFDPDGRKSSEGTSVNNKTEGPVRHFYEDGSVKSKGYYIHYRNPIGWWTFYDRAGNVVSRRRFTR